MLEVVVLAAGRGTRMHSDLPKVLHTLGGKPMVSHVLDTARRLNASQLHVIIGHGAEEVRDVVDAPDVQCHLQNEQLGTGHAVQQAASHWQPDSRVLVLFGDVPMLSAEALLPMLVQDHNGPAVLATFLDDPTGYGRIVRNEQGEFTGVVEHKDASTAERRISEVNTGVLAARGAELADWLSRVGNDNTQGEYYLPDVLSIAVADGHHVSVIDLADSEQTLGVNDRAQLEYLERSHQRRNAERLLRQGVAIADRSRIDVRGELQCGRNVSIDVNAVLEGHVTLGDGVRVGPNCVLRDVVVGNDTNIAAFSHLENASIGQRCSIGPYARLRPGTALDDEARIGNFVETKNAKIGAGSKANHLAYVGDAEVGSGSNIGAGTITCNYDGANKHKTRLGDGVFIGSNSTLVAPLDIADGGFVAAGSTVTRAVNADQLAVSRGKQRNIDGWQRPTKKTDEES